MVNCDNCNKDVKKLRQMYDKRLICNTCYLNESSHQPKSEVIPPKLKQSFWNETKLKKQISILKKSNAEAVKKYADIKTKYDVLVSEFETAKKLIIEFNKMIKSDSISSLFELINKWKRNKRS